MRIKSITQDEDISTTGFTILVIKIGGAGNVALLTF